MEKKEYYKNLLPHFQQPGQAYFVTWCIKDSVPTKAMDRYSSEIESIRVQLQVAEKQGKANDLVEKLKIDYYRSRRKYIHAYDQLLAQNHVNTVNLMKPELMEIVFSALRFWECKRLENYAFCTIPNHVHWVFRVLEQDENGNPVYLQNIMQSVKRHSASRINKVLGRTGKLWQKESFDTTIRDEKHLTNAISYTLNNPVASGFVTDWTKWKGSWCNPECGIF